MKKELATLSQEAANMESRLNAEVSSFALHQPICGTAGGCSLSRDMCGPLQPAPYAVSSCSRPMTTAFSWPRGSAVGPTGSASHVVQVANSRSTKAENTTLQNELSALQEQLSTSASQLEEEQATSEALLFPSPVPGCNSVVGHGSLIKQPG